MLATFISFAIGQAVNPAAFDPLLNNSIPNVGGPVLYYNGSGPVPPYNSSTPSPPSLPALTYSPLPYSDINFIVVRRNSKISSTQKSYLFTAERSSPTIALHALRSSKSFTSQLWLYLLRTPLISLSACVISHSLRGQIVLANSLGWAIKGLIWCKCMPR